MCVFECIGETEDAWTAETCWRCDAGHRTASAEAGNAAGPLGLPMIRMLERSVEEPLKVCSAVGTSFAFDGFSRHFIAGLRKRHAESLIYEANGYQASVVTSPAERVPRT